MERKALAAEFKADTSKRLIEGYASTFGNRDHANDVVLPGAYKRTLNNRMGRIKVMRDHKILIGKPIHAEEDGKGLFTVNQISKTQEGDDALTLVADGVLDAMSIQYETVKSDYEMHSDGQKARMLKELKLYEWGPVTFPCNESAAITAVKQLEDLDRAFHDFKAQKISAADLVALIQKATAPEPAPLDAPDAKLLPPALDPDTSDSAAQVAELKAYLRDIRTQIRRAA